MMGTKYINSKSSIMDEHLDGTTEHLMSSDTGSRVGINNEVLVVKLENTTHCDEDKSTLQENFENERKRKDFKVYETVRRMIGKCRLPTEKWRLLAIVICVLIASVSIVAIVFRLTETSQKEQVRDTSIDDDNASTATLARHDQEIKEIRKSFLGALNTINASQDMAMKAMQSEFKVNYKRGLIKMNETRNLILHAIKKDLSTNFTRDLLALDQRLVMQITQTENNLENLQTKLSLLSKKSEGQWKQIQSNLADQSSRLSNMQSSFESKVGQLKMEVHSLRQRLSNNASGLLPTYFFSCLPCLIVFINL